MSVSPIDRLRAGELIDDATFDSIYPDDVRAVSAVHWTRVEVARRAAQLLTFEHENVRVLDIGSGVGKLCIVGALTTDASFTGVEHRRPFHELARSIVLRHHVTRVELLRADFADLDFRAFDGVYLYNPFYEHIDPSVRLEDHSSDGRLAHTRDVLRLLNKLAELPRNARVVTHHGFGAALPSAFRRTHYEVRFRLERWVRG